MVSKRQLTAVALLLSVRAFGATWYASANGNSTNGTSAEPWGVQYAVTNSTGNPYLQPGDTVLFKPGTFSCVESDASTYGYDKLLVFRRAGDAGNKITYRPETLWGFTFDGGLVVPASSSNLVIRDFIIGFSGMTNRDVLNYAGYALGINHFAPDVEIMHNVIGNCGHPGIGSWSATAGKYIAGNIVRFVGFNDYDQSTGTAAGSAMYLQQSDLTPEALIQGNITYWNYTTGMKAYGNQNINGFSFKRNIVFSAYEGGIFYHQDQVDSQGFQSISNYVWDGGASGLRVGYQLGNANPSNAVIAGNYVVETGNGRAMGIEDGWFNLAITNNTFVAADYRAIISLETQGNQTNFITTHDWDYNTYFAGADTGFGQHSFAAGTNSGMTFQTWTNTIADDVHSTLTTGAPPATVSFAFAPSTDTNFVHVAVFNWPTNATTTVDVSGYIPNGKRLYIYDAQNIPTAYTNFIYNGGDVTLELGLTNYAPMLGVFGDCAGDCRDDVWSGFDPRFRAFVLYAQPVVAGTVNTMNVDTLILR